MNKPAGFYDLRQALAEPGCPLCQLLAHNADRYVDAMLWELVNDIPAREEFNQARGYCREHAWLLVRRGASLGAAILMLDVLETVLRVLEADRSNERTGFSWQQWWPGNPPAPAAGLIAGLTPQALCPVCRHVATGEAYYLAALLAHLSGPDSLAPAYETSDGLCLPHLRRALAEAPDGPNRETLIRLQKAVWERLRLELREFIRKNDYRFAKESVGEEGTAWLRAIELLAGPPFPKVKE